MYIEQTINPHSYLVTSRPPLLTSIFRTRTSSATKHIRSKVGKPNTYLEAWKKDTPPGTDKSIWTLFSVSYAIHLFDLHADWICLQ